MIPILFATTETDFTHNGIGRLVDCLSCSVTEERNGIYELELKYPITGKWFDELIQGGIVGVIHDDNHDIQPFDIYKTSAVIDGVVTVNAHHISYRLNNVILEPYTASSASAAIAGISAHSVNTNPFTFTTDKSVNASFSLDRPASVRSILWGQEGSILDVFGTADFKFDTFSVQMLQHRGSDTGVTVRYGKNMTGIDWTHDKSGTCNAIAPYWTDGVDVVFLPEVIVRPTTPINPVKPAVLDMSDKFQEKPSVADLRSAAVSYLDMTEPWNPSDNIKIDFIPFWQMLGTQQPSGSDFSIENAFTIQTIGGNDYLVPVGDSVSLDGDYIVIKNASDLASVQRVGLCDTVSIYWTDLGIVSEKAKIVKVVYDVLAERFTELEVGTVSTSYVAISDGIQTTTKTAERGTVIDSGSFTITAGANGYTDHTVLFNVTFTTLPAVTLTLKSTTTSASAVSDSNIILSDDPTITGFSCRLFNGYSQSITRIVYWSAIGH